MHPQIENGPIGTHLGTFEMKKSLRTLLKIQILSYIITILKQSSTIVGQTHIPL